MNFHSFSGIVTAIEDYPVGEAQEAGCYKMFTIDNGYGQIVNFIVDSATYFVDHAIIRMGDRVTGFYDADAPAIFIYPPQYRAIVMSLDSPYRQVKVDYFNRRLESRDGTLQLTLSPQTQLSLTNGQPFTGNVGRRNLVVVYGATTRSIPAQAVPSQIIVLCL